MATVTFKGNPIHTSGELPALNAQSPAFKLTMADLSDVGLEKFQGKNKILNIVPSLDTGICAKSAKRFHDELTEHNETVLLNISADLPFAQSRFCQNEKLPNIVTLSTMRSPTFGKDYGVQIVDGPLAGLLSRAVLVLDKHNRVVYREQVPEIAQEPNYSAALEALRNI